MKHLNSSVHLQLTQYVWYEVVSNSLVIYQIEPNLPYAKYMEENDIAIFCGEL